MKDAPNITPKLNVLLSDCSRKKYAEQALVQAAHVIQYMQNIGETRENHIV